MITHKINQFCLLFAILPWILFTLGIIQHTNIHACILALISLFFLCGIKYHKLVLPLYNIYMKIGDVMHCIVSPLLFGSIFIFIFAPLGLLARIFAHKKQLNDTSYFTLRNTPCSNMKEQF